MACDATKTIVAGFAAALIGMGGTAHASRSQIDSTSSPLAAASLCTIGSSCTALGLPFSANFGTGPFSSVYVYSNGLVSIGSQIASGADLSSLASIGVDVFTPGFSPGGLVQYSNFTVQNPALATNATGVLFNKPVFRVTYDVNLTSDTSNKQKQQFSIFDVGAGQYALQFAHGDFFGSGTPIFASDGYLGYSFGGSGIQRSGAALISEIEGGKTPFEYFFPASGGAVPEPSSWLMMVSGFGLLGVMLRRRKTNKRLVPA